MESSRLLRRLEIKSSRFLWVKAVQGLLCVREWQGFFLYGELYSVIQRVCKQQTRCIIQLFNISISNGKTAV